MNVKTWICALMALAWTAGAAAPQSESTPTFDLAGNWGGGVEFGKMKINLVVKVSKAADGRLSGTIDIPDQGARGIPVNAMLCNVPDVRWEIDAFDNTAFNGKVSPDGNQIVGSFDEGPGGRPINVTFKRLPNSAATEPKLDYVSPAGEPRDVRGYWLASVPGERGNSNRVALKIGRAPDGTFRALMDMLDRGANDIPATSIGSTNGAVRIEWQLFRIVFDGKLDAGGDRLAGNWQGRGPGTPVTFQRLERPAQALPEDLSFTPNVQAPDDVRGEWNGLLQTPDNRKIRLVLRIGRTPQGILGGTLSSPDQGGGALPMTGGGITNQQVRLEWNGINGVFKGALTNQGSVLDGTWEQMGLGLKLRLERTASGPKEQSQQ